MGAATTATAKLSSTQRTWLKKMGAALDAPAADVRLALGPEDLIDPLKKLTEPHSCQVRVVNESGQPLKLDPLSIKEVDDEKQIGLSHGKYDSMPPDPVAANNSGEFKASSNTVLGQTLTGVEGRVRYFLDDQKTAWIIHFNNPFKGKNTADVLLDGPNKANFESPKPTAGSGNDAVYLFTLKGKGGTGPGPGPGPGPTPGGVDAASSCHVTITNDTKLTLTLGNQGHERGDFMTFPAKTLAPGASTSFVSVETPNAKDAKDEGCKGFLLWQVGSPSVLWRVEWDNPEQSKNSVTASFNPPNSGFTSLNQIGQGEENVPTSFTISGGGGVTPPPPGTAKKLLVTVLEEAGNKPIDGATVVVADKTAKTAGGGKATFELPPGTHKFKATADGFKPSEGVTEMPADKDSELTIFMEKEGSDFTPPPESKQPTLRRGAKSEDKWVEYLQQLLGIPIDGKFGPATEAAVRKFQTDNKLQVDGIVGNQTWAALRGNTPEPPSTDGRKPNTFVEKGPEARWFTENKNIASYDKAKDELRIVCVSLGDAKIDDFEAKVQVAKGGGSTSGFKKPPVISIKIGPSFKELPSGGFLHAVRIPKFRATHGSGTHAVEAFLPLDLGGDNWKGDVEVS